MGSKMELLNDRMRCEWDTNNSKQTEHYKSLYQKAKAAGRQILSPNDNKPLPSFREVLIQGGFVVGETELTDSQFAMRLFNETGDTRLIWDSGRPKELAEAEKLFNEYVQKGWRAYAIGAQGKPTARRIFAFDAKLEEVFFDDKRTLKESLSAFVKSFKEIKMTPKTYPG